MRASLYPKIPLSHPLRLCGARSFFLRDHWLITAYNQQVCHFFLLLGHIKKGRESNGVRERERDSSSFRFSGLRSSSLSGRMDGSCVCACSCLPLSPRGASPLFPQRAPEVRAALSLDLAAQHREESWERAAGGGAAPNRAKSHLNELEMQLENRRCYF